MAFWGAPTPNEHQAEDCVRAAVEIQRAVQAINDERARENARRAEENTRRIADGRPALPPLRLLSIGTGINTGQVIVGLMGSDAHIVNYTVFGREVNLASRLEGQSGSGRIYIGEATFMDLQLDDPALASTCVELDPITVKGFRSAVKVYEVPWRPVPAP
jgi:adenylate cyclase